MIASSRIICGIMAGIGILSCTVIPKVSDPAPTTPTVSLPLEMNAVRDSLLAIGNIFNGQLRLAGVQPVQINVNSVTNSGLSLLLRTEAGNAGVSFPDALKSFNPEGYFTKATSNSIVIVGNSVAALQHAAFNYLEQLGFRYFIPGEVWNVVPKLKSAYHSFERLTQPAFEFRFFANGHGFNRNKTMEERFNFWHSANQMGGFFPVTIGHSYQTIVNNNKDIFKEHPEYFAGDVKKGELPAIPKFDVTNKDLVELVKKDAVARVKEARRVGQFKNMLSMEPSDGGGFCNSPSCLKIGGPSEQVFYLANQVAKHFQKELPGVWVGSLAYNEHILPVKQKLQPNVFVMITNGFNRTKYSTYELVSQWMEKASKVGIYDYLSVYEWDNDLPGRSSGTQLDYLTRTINNYYSHGARAYIAETTMGWVSKGLGQYLVTRLLWDPKVNVDSLTNDFYTRSFGNAAPEINKLFKSWETSSKGFISDNQLSDWLEYVEEAGKKSIDNSVKKRLEQLKIYLHYIVLYKQLKSGPSIETMKAVLVFANRTFETGAFSAFPTMVSLPQYSGFASMGYRNPSDQPWKKETNPVSSAEIDQFFKSDRALTKKVEGLKDFPEASTFEKTKTLTTTPIRQPISSFLGQTKFVLRIVEKSAGNYFEITSGFSARPYQDRPLTIKIFPYTFYQQVKEEADLVLSDTQWAKKTIRKVSLSGLAPGEYMVVINDLDKIFNIQFFGRIKYNVLMSPDKVTETTSLPGLNNFYFMVPSGVKRIIVHKSKTVKLKSPSGRILPFVENKQDSHIVDIQPGEEGLWQAFYQTGKLFIEGVPPYLGIQPDKILIPTGLFQ